MAWCSGDVVIVVQFMEVWGSGGSFRMSENCGKRQKIKLKRLEKVEGS